MEIHYICSCGQRHNFSSSFGGSTDRCRQCGSSFVVPLDPDYEAMKKMEFAIIPLGTRRGLVCSRFVRYGKEPNDAVYWHQPTDTFYHHLTWPDKAMWVSGEALDRLKESAKGKRKAFPVKITEITPPTENMTRCGSIQHC